MALYHQLKFPSTFIEYRSVSEWKGVVVISNFDSLEAAPSKIYRPRQLPSLPRPKFAPGGCGDTIGPPDDEQRAARNMLRSVV